MPGVGLRENVRVMGRIQSRYRQPGRTRQAFSEHDLRAEHSTLARGYPEPGTANHTAATPSAPPPTPPTQAEPAGEEPTRHDEYGKLVLRTAAPQAEIYGPTVAVDYGAGQHSRIDGTVGDIAVKIESRVPNQVRGAVLDLICYPFPKKLLVLLPVHMTNAEITADQCRNALARFCPAGSF